MFGNTTLLKRKFVTTTCKTKASIDHTPILDACFRGNILNQFFTYPYRFFVIYLLHGTVIKGNI